ncbi:RNA polymerase, alpha chain C terminal domain [Nakamurella panacisegetis]|uniref:RNA polymerase, alpha chain C terminal domain n=1 Tax=Nakamurella panacisegetis TaxID=1090615 RepID=A0A1H0ISH3_9ACTN|nr:sigma factor-like helix-turn-helix DNA-binding protein [Nakamurella panacisegetis]SDO34394.1 RNA polymerase, alpha chain C terminal domain [Nakamurella panacisegetis]
MTEGFDRGRHAAPANWADAFPWLPSVVSDEQPDGWPNVALDSTPELREERISAIATSLISRLSNRALGEVLPTLPPSTTIASLSLSTRGQNMVHRAGYRTTGDLDELSPLDMLQWRGMGAGTLDDIIQSLVDRSAQHAARGYARDITDGARRLTPKGSHCGLGQDAPQQTPYAADLRTLADWAAFIGATEEPVLAGPLPPWAPAGAKEALDRLLKLVPRDIEDPSGRRADVATKLTDALEGLDDRQLDILARRMFADYPATLDELGRELGVTRERIRQIESKERAHLSSLIAPGGALADIGASVRHAIGQVMPLDDLLELFPSLGQWVAGVEQPAWRVLDRIDDGYEIENGWCLTPSRTAVRADTQVELQELADQYGVVRLEAITLVKTIHGERQAEVTAAWLDSCGGYVVDGGHVFSRTSSVGDYAAAILSVTGTPLGSQEIVDRFAFERSVGSLRNAMSVDDRFKRIDRDRWALTEWGMDAYAGIRSKIREVVTQSGGTAQLDDLIESITSRYSVSASSVVTYASAPPFETRDGIVRVADTKRGERKTPARTRRLFRRDDAWAYRLRISTEHLRGSGSVAPIAVASLLNLEYGETRLLETPLGPQTIAWTGTQPQFGTIRRFLMEGDMQADTEAFLVIRDDGTFAFEPARHLMDKSLEDALTLVGARAGLQGDKARAALAVAVGLPATTPVTSIIAAYRERGDGEIADLITDIRQELEAGQSSERVEHSAEVDDILSLL